MCATETYRGNFFISHCFLVLTCGCWEIIWQEENDVCNWNVCRRFFISCWFLFLTCEWWPWDITLQKENDVRIVCLNNSVTISNLIFIYLKKYLLKYYLIDFSSYIFHLINYKIVRHVLMNLIYHFFDWNATLPSILFQKKCKVNFCLWLYWYITIKNLH